ncbi:5-formyltetrahydrofolate cyclo-ligase [Sandarakinorhabdus sp. AAP62]|uniref:5-formyltetrahydrofolate cyclo-ligase n=1 Tax=Sandarakinorhabdus sp. AAP62 TaxID=1248916 RepID=UPI0002F93E50|nr:5-formyltetrahydrofolate cyclo-ligase [Sandarakinorhabdus sp. AAP62]
MTKTDLRRHYRAARKAFVAALPAGEREALERNLAALVAPALANVRMAGSYAAVGDEIDPMWIEKELGPHAFPRIAGQDIVFHQAEWSALKPGFQNIPEPPVTAPVVQPDVLLVPLVAVTLAGVRLGQGRGYYDRALAALRHRHPVLAIGIAWECQIAPALPAEPWDMPLDMIATPQRLVDCRKSR